MQLLRCWLLCNYLYNWSLCLLKILFKSSDSSISLLWDIFPYFIALLRLFFNQRSRFYEVLVSIANLFFGLNSSSILKQNSSQCQKHSCVFFFFFCILFLRLFSKFFSFLYLRLPWSFLSRNCIFLVL